MRRLLVINASCSRRQQRASSRDLPGSACMAAAALSLSLLLLSLDYRDESDHLAIMVSVSDCKVTASYSRGRKFLDSPSDI